MAEPYTIGSLLSETFDEAKRARGAAARQQQELEAELAKPTQYPTMSAPELGALPLFLSTLLSNTASAVSGNPLYAQGAARRLEAQETEQRQVRQENRQLTVQDIAARRQNLLQLKSQALAREYDAAVKAGDNALALKTLDLRLKTDQELQKAQIEFQKNENQLNREQEDTLRRLGFETQKDIAGMNMGLTGDPTIDGRLKGVNAYRNLLSIVDDAMRAAKEKDLNKFLKKNPTYANLVNLAEGIITRPAKGESAQQYANFLEATFPGQRQRVVGLVKKYFPNEEIVMEPQGGGGATSRGGGGPQSRFGRAAGSVMRTVGEEHRRLTKYETENMPSPGIGWLNIPWWYNYLFTPVVGDSTAGQ